MGRSIANYISAMPNMWTEWLGRARPLRLQLFEYDQRLPSEFTAALQQLEEVPREATAAELLDRSVFHLR
jgi:hypothetical protein